MSPNEGSKKHAPGSHNFVHNQPTARVVVSGPGRIILHGSPVHSPPPRQVQHTPNFNQHNSPPPPPPGPPHHHPPTKNYQTTTKRQTHHSSPTPSQQAQHHFNMNKNNNHNAPHSKVNPIPVKREEFRASQPIPVFEKVEHPQPDVLSEERFLSKIQSDLTSSNVPQAYSYSSIKHYVDRPEPSSLFQFTASDNIVNEFENTWQPAMPSPGYTPNVGSKSAEIQQYHSQERISFYPEKHPEYFQLHENDNFNAVKPSVFDTTTNAPTTTTARSLRRKPQSSSSFQSASVLGKKATQRKPYQFKKTSYTTPSTVDSSEQVNKESVFKFNDSLLAHNVHSKIKPVYEDHSDEQLPMKRYGDADAYDSENEPEDQIYQSVLVSSSLLTSAEHSGNSLMFVTPSKPDLSEVDRTTASTPSTTSTTTTSTTPRSVRGRPVRKHTRVFKRKFVAPPSMDSGSCETTCLSNIVNHEYDPVCGSDDKTYTNVGRLRCSKICGENRKLILTRMQSQNN